MQQALQDPSRFRDPARNTSSEISYRAEMDAYIQDSLGSPYEKMENFAKYVSRQTLARFLALSAIFEKALNVQGDVIECGVNWGGGLMTFAQLSAVLEPVNLQRRIIGFDTFSGFTPPKGADTRSIHPAQMREGGFAANSFDDLQRCIQLYDANRFLGHVPKVLLVKGDASETIPAYFQENPHTVVSLLHLDFDLYEPTKVAIEHCVPRMPKGAVILFDELNNRTWPGETVAVLESLGIRSLRIERFPYEPHVSYAVLE